LAKLFADTHGHEAVIEILLCKQKGEGAKPYIKILNGLVQVPQLVQKLIESGLIETVKLVNDIYIDDQDIIYMNFDTMKKISNLKMGREFLIKKNLIPNLIKNIKFSAQQKDPKAVISGFSIVDNISRSDIGKDALKSSNAIENISKILDFFENDDRVLLMGAKIYSKISNSEDMIREIEKLNTYNTTGDFTDLRSLEKSLVLISNFILVDDICKLLCEEKNLQVLQNLFDSLCSIDLNNKDQDFIKTYLLLNKYFMIVFNRIFSSNPHLFEDEKLYNNINNSIIKNWEYMKGIIGDNSEKEEDLIKSFIQAYKEYFASYSDLIDKYTSTQGKEKVDLRILRYILNMLNEAGGRYFQLDEKANYAASKILKIANKFENEEIQNLLEKLFLYIKGVINTSEYSKTLANNLEVLFGILQRAESLNSEINLSAQAAGNEYLSTSSNVQNDKYFSSSQNENSNLALLKQQILPVILNFMITKPKFRLPNYLNLQILELIMQSKNFMENYFKNLSKNSNSNLNLINPIISVMSRHLYETSTVLKVVSVNSESNSSFKLDRGNTSLNLASNFSTYTDDSLPDEKLENNINSVGAALLEKLIDENEFKKHIKNFKDTVNSFNPSNSNIEAITNIEFNLLYFFAILKIKNYFSNGLSEILENLKLLIKKEISSIENFKRDKNNEKNEKYSEIIQSSSKRLNLEIAILKLINENCTINFEESGNEAFILHTKEVLNTILEIFEKSSDSSNLIDLLSHLQKNIEFLLENEINLSNCEVKNLNKPTGIMNNLKNFVNTNIKQGGKYENVKFEDSVIEKVTNVMMNLLRKNPDDESLAENIIKTFVQLSNKKPETPNCLVKAGCPRLLLQIVENTSNTKLGKNSLELIKLIALSSEENLQMVCNQNILEKLHEVHTKFASDEDITSICDVITNEMIKLPGQEKVIEEILKSNLNELHEVLSNNQTISDTSGKLNLLNNLEKINAFSSNKKQIEFLSSQNFLSDLEKIILSSVQDKEVTDINEKLLQNEISLLKKINEEIKNKSSTLSPEEKQKKISIITNSLLLLMKEKSNFRDIFLSSSRQISNFLSDENIFEQNLKTSLNTQFVDSLFETSENYIDDSEVSKEINNILCNLCLRSEQLANYIVQKGGLKNVMEELKSSVSLNDPNSKLMKINGLKFLHSLVKDNSNMEKFLNSNGVNLIFNLIKNEISTEERGQPDYDVIENRYLTNSTFNLEIKPEDFQTTGGKDSSHIIYCLKIMNQNLEKNISSFTDPNLFKNILTLLENNYPNKKLLKNGIKIFSKLFAIKNDSNEQKIEDLDKILLARNILSNLSHYITDSKLWELIRTFLLNEKIFGSISPDEEYLTLLKQKSDENNNLLQDNISINSKKSSDKEKSHLQSTKSEFNRFLTYATLAAELNLNKINSRQESDDYLYKIYSFTLEKFGNHINTNTKSLPFDEGIVLALMRLTSYFQRRGKINKQKFEEKEISQKLLNIGLHFYRPSNYIFASQFLNEFSKIYSFITKELDSQGNYAFKSLDNQTYTNYLQNVYLRSFDFFDHYLTSLNLNNGVTSNIPQKVEENLSTIISLIINYYKLDQDNDIKVSSIKQLVSSILTLLSHEKIKNNQNDKNSQIRKNLWELLQSVTVKDLNNLICGTDEVIHSILDLLFDSIRNSSNNSEKDKENLKFCREYLKTISNRLENNLEVFEKIIDFISHEITNHELKDRETCILPYIEVLANLSKFPLIPKLILKNNNSIFTNLKKIFADKNYINDTLSRLLLSMILKNLLSNNLNSEIIAETHQDLIKTILNNIQNAPLDLAHDSQKDIAKNEIEGLTCLINDNFKQVMGSLVRENDIQTIKSKFSAITESKDKLDNLLEKVSQVNQSKMVEESLAKDRETSKSLVEFIKEMFDQHMKELQSYVPEQSGNTGNSGSPDLSTLNNPVNTLRNSTKMLTTQSNIAKISAAPRSKLSVISKTLFYNSDNTKIKSPLSCKDNCDIPQSIDNILSLIRKLYSESKSEKDQKILSEKLSIIESLLSCLKYLSVSPDNHIPILETGLINFTEKLINDPEKPINFYIDALDIIKNCTYSENSIPVFIGSSAAEPIVKEVLHLYENPEVLNHNQDIKKLFFNSNMIFSNLCRYKKGFQYLFNKIGMEKLISVGRKTSHVDILTAIVEMLVNYMQNSNQSGQKENAAEKENSLKLQDSFSKEVLSILSKCLNLNSNQKTGKLISSCLNLAGLIYKPEISNEIIKLDLIKSIYSDFDKYKEDPQFLNAVLFCLGEITLNNTTTSREVLDSGLLNKIKEVCRPNINNEIFIEHITALYKSLVMNNLENIEKFCNTGVVVNLFYCLENYWDKQGSGQFIQLNKKNVNNNDANTNTNTNSATQTISLANQIVLNCVSTLDCMTISDKAISSLADTKFSKIIFETIDKKQNEIEIIKTILHLLGNYLYKEIGNNLRTINFEKLLQILISLQKKHYSNSEILININYIAGYLIKIMKDNSAKEKLYLIISSSLKMQDWNAPLVVMTLKLMQEILTVNPSLIDEVFEDNMQCLFNILKIYKDNPEAQMSCFKIFSLFGKNSIYSYTMVNAGLIDFIKTSLEICNDDISLGNKNRHQIREVVFNLLSVLSNDSNNAKKISDVVMENLLKDLKSEEYSEDHDNVIHLIYNLCKHKYCIEPVIQFNGIEPIIKILQQTSSTSNVNLIFDVFSILSYIADSNDEYKRMMQNLKVPSIVDDTINRCGYLDKKIEFEGRSLIFTINSTQVKLDELEELNYVEVKVENPIKTDVKNFLVNGKIVKM
jgi:hypothetical protein